MDKSQENKKCFCARCFLPIDCEDRVDVDGQNFHRICSMCCICRMIPTSLKMFYGHVFCNDCFKTHVITKFKGDNPRIQSNSWWMQWGLGEKPEQKKNNDEKTAENPSEEPPKRFICSRCLQPVDEASRVTIGDQNFHAQCGQCYFCHKVPSSNLKIYYGQVFCEECFHRHVLNRNRDNPSDFFKNCFEQWQKNAQFAENMKDFMGGNRDSAPFIFMMQGQQPPFCRCGTGPQDWFQGNEARTNEPRKSATPATISFGEDTNSWDLPIEYRTESIPDFIDESANQENSTVVAEKIEKLTKYLHVGTNLDEKWKFLEEDLSLDESFHGWIDLQSNIKSQNCPKCLWQCGPIYVNSEYLQNCLR